MHCVHLHSIVFEEIKNVETSEVRKYKIHNRSYLLRKHNLTTLQLPLLECSGAEIAIALLF